MGTDSHNPLADIGCPSGSRSEDVILDGVEGDDLNVTSRGGLDSTRDGHHRPLKGSTGTCGACSPSGENEIRETNAAGADCARTGVRSVEELQRMVVNEALIEVRLGRAAGIGCERLGGHADDVGSTGCGTCTDGLDRVSAGQDAHIPVGDQSLTRRHRVGIDG